MSLFPILSPVAKNAVTVSFVGVSKDATNLTTYTFSSHAIGTAATSRKVVVAISTGGASVTAASSVTIGGVSATLVIAKTINPDNNNTEIWQAAVPTGTTGDIVVVWNAAALHCGIGVWAVYDAASAASATASTSFASGTDLSASINIPEKGVCISSAHANNVRTFVAQGLTEDYEDNIESGRMQVGGSDAFATQQTGLTVGTTVSSADIGVLVVASWGPA